MARSHRNILIIAATWIGLYFAAIYSVRMALIYGDSRYWATPVWLLLYIIPGYLAGHYFHNNWILVSILIGLIGTLLWLFHAQLPLFNLYAAINAVLHSLLCLLGAWVGQRKVAI